MICRVHFSSYIPPFLKGGEGGFRQARTKYLQVRSCPQEIPLSPPLRKGEVKVLSDSSVLTATQPLTTSASNGYTPFSSCTSLPFSGGLNTQATTMSSLPPRSRCLSC